MIRFRALVGRTVGWTYEEAAFARFNQDVWPVVKVVPGYLSEIEAFFLYETARTLTGAPRGIDIPDGQCVVEIGSYKGRSAIAIGSGLKENENLQLKLVCIDPFFATELDKDLAEAFGNNIETAGLTERVELIADYSQVVVQTWPPERGIVMLWIDGNHEYEHVRDDFLNWSRHLLPGGVVAFHDWKFAGVRATIERHLLTQDWYQDLSIIDHNLVAARRIDLPAPPRQKAQKKRVHAAMRTGHTSPFVALILMIRDALNRPFGSLLHFFTSKLDVK